MLAAFVLLVLWPANGTRGPAALEQDAVGTGNGLNVVELPTPWLAGGCGNGCWNSYLELAARAREGSLDPSKDSRSGLAGRIVDGLAIGFLLDGLAERPLAVAVVGESRSAAGVLSRRLLFWDPAVGSFEALLLLPPGEGPFPAVLGLHGHRDDPEIFTEEFLGERLAQSGFAVLMPHFRVEDCSLLENWIAQRLLDSGLTLMGLRVYETLLMHKYLEHESAVDGRRVGLLSHSGGSSTANLVVRLSDAFSAHVSDYQVDFHNFCGPLGVHCETVPALEPLAEDINDFDTLDLPHKLVPYKFADPELRDEIVDFSAVTWANGRNARVSKP